MITPTIHTGMITGGPVNGQIVTWDADEFEVKVMQRTLATLTDWRSPDDRVQAVTHTYQWDPMIGMWVWKGPRT